MEGIDLRLLGVIASNVLSAFLGAWFKDRLERRSKLVAWYEHSTGVTVRDDGGQPKATVHLHSIVIRNNGKKTSQNVRVTHVHVPNRFDYSVFPDGLHSEIAVENGKQIHFMRLAPGQQVSITYIYPHTMTWQQLNTHIQDDEGIAQYIQVVPIRRLSRTRGFARDFLLGSGLVAVLYVLASAVWRLWQFLASSASS